MPIKIAMAQMSQSTDVEKNLTKGLEMMECAAKEGAQAICFAELCFLPFFPHDRSNAKHFTLAEPVNGATVRRIQAAAQRLSLVTVINIYEVTDRGDYYDSAVVIDADGTMLGTYRMTHLAENAAFNEKYYYWPGNQGYPVFSTAIGRVGVAVCHDRNFPEVFRALALDGAQVVFVPTAYSWAGYESSREFFEIPNQAASMANAIFTVCVNRVGPGGCVEELPGVSPRKLEFCGGSFVTGPTGRVIGRAATGQEEVKCIDLPLEEVQIARQRRPFFRDRRPETYQRLLSY